jgi:hypothetical protein
MQYDHDSCSSHVMLYRVREKSERASLLFQSRQRKQEEYSCLLAGLDINLPALNERSAMASQEMCIVE